jgi:amino acid adenylation domain-containing protein
LLSRHQALRTRFTTREGALRLVEAGPESVPPVDIERCRLPHGNINTLVETEIGPIDLFDERPLRVVLHETAAGHQIVVLAVHSCVLDDRSLAIVADDLRLLHSSKGSSEDLPPSYDAHTDHVVQEADAIAHFEAQARDFWLPRLDAARNPLRLTFLREPKASDPTGSVAEIVDRGLRRLLSRFATSHDVPVPVVLLAALQVLQYRYAGEEEGTVVTGLGVDTRPNDDRAVGLYENVVPFVSQVARHTSFMEVICSLKRDFELLTGGIKHVPFAAVLRSIQRSGEFDAVAPQLTASYIPRVRAGSPKGADPIGYWRTVRTLAPLSPIEVRFLDDSEEIVVEVDYSARLVGERSAAQLARHFVTLLASLVTEPRLAVTRFSMLTSTEQHRITHGFNALHQACSPRTTIHARFENRVRSSPDAPALVTLTGSLTYGGLNAEANRVAHLLRSRGVRHGDRVAVCLERSTSLVCSLLGILKAGGAYVPLEPQYPSDRLQLMLQDSGATALLTQSALMASLPRLPGLPVLCLDRDRELSEMPTESIPLTGSPDDLAYVMYTSGSTGVPKGVATTHHNVTSLVTNANYVDLDQGKRLLLMAPISFDASTFELWAALLNGAVCGVAPPGPISIEVLGKVVQDLAVDTLWLTTALFNEMIEAAPETLAQVRQLLTGGDAASPEHFRRAASHLPRTRLINGYGPTETTTFATTFDATSEASRGTGAIPIGRPLQNTSIYILDHERQPVPIGVPGEIYIGGEGVARGYLGKPTMTAERFLPNPFDAGRLYRTGDLGRYSYDGVVEFLGRADQQVKIRGHRIEPGEIEAALLEHSDVKATTVVVDIDDRRSKRLIAYVVLGTGERPSGSALRSFLVRKLPPYMLPSAIVEVDRLPLTPSGKVDRRSLPKVPERSQVDSDYVGPGNEVERALTSIWADVLSIGRIGVHDNFFALGGDSLLAMKIGAAVRDRLGHEVDLRLVFDKPTVADMAAALDHDRAPEGPHMVRAVRRRLHDAIGIEAEPIQGT